MTDKAAFLRAICERPDDDLPRLVFADYLDERGQPDRAELIRMQCGQIPYDAARYPSLCRAGFRKQVKPIYGDGTVAHSKGHAGWATKYCTTWPYSRHRMRRGFVDQCEMTFDVWSRYAAAILAVCPIRGAKAGHVVLTSLPETISQRPAGIGVEYQLPGGRTWKYLSRSSVAELGDRHIVECCLALEYPGVAFELPVAGGDALAELVRWARVQPGGQVHRESGAEMAIRRNTYQVAAPEARP